MLFSVIVSVYNIENYIRKCIRCVLSQTFTDYELLLIDDGSTDKSGRICDEYVGKYKQVRVVHQENQGIAQVRNVGIEMAEGDYLLFLDGDDYWHGTDCLWKLAQYIRTHGFDVVAYRGVSAYTDGKKIFYCDNLNDWKEDAAGQGYKAQDFLKTHLKANSNFHWCLWLYAFSGKLFEDGALRFPRGRMDEDLYLAWRILLKAERIGVLPDYLYIYRRYRTGSITHGRSPQYIRDKLWVIEHNIRDVQSEKMDAELKQYLLNTFSVNYFSGCVLACFLSRKDRRKMTAQLEKNSRIMDYAQGKAYGLAREGSKIIGFRNMLRLLHAYECWLRCKRRLQFFLVK